MKFVVVDDDDDVAVDTLRRSRRILLPFSLALVTYLDCGFEIL